MGPLLFLVFINDFPQSNPFFKFSLFADDSTISCKFLNNNLSIIKRELSNQLIPVSDWLQDNKIKINCEKSKFIVFSYRKNHNLNFIRFGNSVIRATSKIKFLGVTIDENLKFKDHVNLISAKISKTIGLLYKLSKIFPSEILRMLYHTLVLPHITYGIDIWFGAADTVLERVIVLQKKIIRAMNSLPFNAHTGDFFKNMNILRVNDLHKLSLAIFMFKNITNSTFNTNSDFHHYNTRFRNNLVIPLHNLTMTQKNWYIRAIKVWNRVPTHIKTSNTLNFFKNELKKHYIGLY